MGANATMPYASCCSSAAETLSFTPKCSASAEPYFWKVSQAKQTILFQVYTLVGQREKTWSHFTLDFGIGIHIKLPNAILLTQRNGKRRNKLSLDCTAFWPIFRQMPSCPKCTGVEIFSCHNADYEGTRHCSLLGFCATQHVSSDAEN